MGKSGCEFENLKAKKGGNQLESLSQLVHHYHLAWPLPGLLGAVRYYRVVVVMADSLVSVEELSASLVREYLARKVRVLRLEHY